MPIRFSTFLAVFALVAVPNAARGQNAAPARTVVPPRAASRLLPPRRPASSFNAFPLLAYSRETHVAFGGFAVRYFRLGDAPPESRPSYVAGAAMYTTRHQALVDIFPELWFARERWMITAQLGYRRFPDSYFGIGNETRSADEERYLFHTFFDRAEVRVRLWRGLFAGARQEFQVHELLDLNPSGLLQTTRVRGTEGGIRSGAGPILVWDSRDNTLSARSGALYQVALLTFQPFLGSDYTYTRFNFDARHYVPLAAAHTLAFQYYLDVNTGDVPFHALAQLGGAVRLRGFFEGRFRDRNYAMAQVEYRIMPVLWRFGMVFFAGVGQVAGSLSDVRLDALHWAVGTGLRFALNPAERVHVRLDVGVGPDTWGAYVNVLEAF